MSISMIAIRIALADSSKKLSKSINYTALKYSSSSSLAVVTCGSNSAEVPTTPPPSALPSPPAAAAAAAAEVTDLSKDSPLPSTYTDLRVTRDITIEHYSMEKPQPEATYSSVTGESAGGENGGPEAALSADSATTTASNTTTNTTAAAATKGTATTTTTVVPANTSQTPFYVGNHSVEIIQGILHLYKENKLTPMGEEAERSDIICMLSVSANKTIHDILQFTAPFNQDIQHIQIIRDSKPNQYMVLLKFHSQRSADEFYNSLNGTAYNSIEPELCHLAFVAHVEVMAEGGEGEEEGEKKGGGGGGGNQLPITGFTELPTCTVCLERMDESVQGILTILCNHSFHSRCFDQWHDCSCPVCRYFATPELLPDSRCSVCGSQSTPQDTLWICLICGHIGCGRYVGGHAREHYRASQHTYVMQLGDNHRVWDYAGEGYVHRLLQSSKDGEPVEHKGATATHGNNPNAEEKIDAVQLEYTYLLTNQLETQRRYYEEMMALAGKERAAEVEGLAEANRHLTEENRRLADRLEAARKERQALEKKVASVGAKLAKTAAGLGEEQALNKSLRANQEEWARRLADIERSNEAKERQIGELQEQLRDVLFFLEAKDKLQTVTEVSKEELQGGQIYIQDNSTAGGGAGGGSSPATTGSSASGGSGGGGGSAGKSKSKHGKGK